MSFGSMLYSLIIGPLQLLFEVIFSCANKVIGNPGLTIIALSLSMNFLVLPLYISADKLQEEERDIQKRLQKGVSHIRKTFKGDERMMILQTYYRQNDYKPTYVLRGAMSLFLEIPFFIAAYQFLSKLPIINGVSFGPIADLSKPDGLIAIGSIVINILPFIMTLINVVSTAIFTKDYPVKTKVQLYLMAAFFLVFLYNSPAGLVFYWTLNNLFSLVKTIFYKLKNPGKVLKVMAFLAGITVILFGLRYVGISKTKTMLLAFAGVVLCIPLVLMIVKRIKPEFGQKLHADNSCDKSLFATNAVFMCVLTGVLIPSAVIKTSTLEFITPTSFYNPIWFVISAACLSIGTFCIWLTIFYNLMDTKIRIAFEWIMTIGSICAAVDYMFFGKNLGILLPSLQYENGMIFSAREKLINLALLAMIVVLMAVLLKRFGKIVKTFLIICTVAIVIMSSVNIVGINRDVVAYSEVHKESNEKASFTLSKNGKNVVVLMLDRAMGEFIPYLMTEKPELKEVFDGFTYYPNTISFGGHTNIASPALYGGYEYQPKEINARTDEALVDKHDEALKVMPVIFDENGFDVTVCDPSIAGYQMIPDLSIYDDYPDISTYITNGMFMQEEENNFVKKARERDFFCYALTKSVPVAVQTIFYDQGNYHSLSIEPLLTESASKQTIIDFYHAEGLKEEFMSSYTVLENMTNMTNIDEMDNSDNFLMMVNYATHEPALLRRDDYVPDANIDNSEYSEEDRLADAQFNIASDRKLVVSDYDMQLAHYHINMGTYLELGKWFDYLKENDVYDNTRIILVSDHGHGMQMIPESIAFFTQDITCDLEYYMPLLMVKDFDAKGFTVDESFMTNADTPSIAFKDIVNNPTNPFTGHSIDASDKEKDILYVFETEEEDVQGVTKSVFDPAMWLQVRTDDARIRENWGINCIDSTLPME